MPPEPHHPKLSSLYPWLLKPSVWPVSSSAALPGCVWKKGNCYQKAGVILGDFFSKGVEQLNIFENNAPRADSEKLMEVLDELNKKDGQSTLYFASQGIQQQWQMKRDMVPPRYMTRYSDMPVVR